MKFSAIFVALPALLLFSGSAMAQNPEVEARDIAAAARAKLVARHNQEWDIYRRDFEPLAARRRCTSSKDCLGMICLNGVCQ